MEHLVLGRTGRLVSVVGLGTWQLGADWGEVTDEAAQAVLEASLAAGVTFYDTADVYGDGRSEKFLGAFRKAHPNAKITIATKMGRRVDQIPENYVLPNFRSWVYRSRENLDVECLDLVQLHCPPDAVYSSNEVYDALDSLVAAGLIKNYGVSVETCHQALEAIKREHLATVQIIFNAFRLKPLDEVLPAASAAGVGVIARVPLASGLLSGKYTAATKFAENDHRNYNRKGEAFDVGETFAGVDYEQGLRAAAEFSQLVREVAPELTPAQAALAWVWQQPGISTVIPGARSVEQARANAAAGSAKVLGPRFDLGVHDIYDRYFREAVHNRW